MCRLRSAVLLGEPANTVVPKAAGEPLIDSGGLGVTFGVWPVLAATLEPESEPELELGSELERELGADSSSSLSSSPAAFFSSLFLILSICFETS